MITRRKSALRTHILAVLRQKHLLSVPVLIKQLRAEGRTVNKTSVYRALEILVESGDLSRQTLDSETLYELSGHHHDHLVCTNCGAVESVECAVTVPETKSGYVVSDHVLTLYGRCPNCQAKLATP